MRVSPPAPVAFATRATLVFEPPRAAPPRWPRFGGEDPRWKAVCAVTRAGARDSDPPEHLGRVVGVGPSVEVARMTTQVCETHARAALGNRARCGPPELTMTRERGGAFEFVFLHANGSVRKLLV